MVDASVPLCVRTLGWPVDVVNVCAHMLEWPMMS